MNGFFDPVIPYNAIDENDYQAMIDLKEKTGIHRFLIVGIYNGIRITGYPSDEDFRKLGEKIRAIREKEIRCGISISPGTPAELLLPYLSEVDMVLIMTVVPGFGGQALIPSCLEKVRFIRQYADRHGLRLDIEVDGGIREDNIGLATEAGANVIVAGSAIFGSKKPRSVIEGMRKAAEAHPYQA